MDILIKKNIIKKNKVIIDIGAYATKLLLVHYSGKKVTVISAKTINYKCDTESDNYNFAELASKVSSEIKGKNKNDLSVSLPAELCESKIISIRNRKESEIPKIIKKEYLTFGRVNPVTHIIDYAFLGKREEDGDTVYYYFLSAVPKSIMAELVAAFAKYKMKIKTIVSSTYNQICLSELYYDEYEHLNRLFVDFGTNTIRITAFSDGVAVYTRSIETGFDSYVRKIFEAQETAGKPEIIKALTDIGENTNLVFGIIGEYFKSLDIEIYTDCIEETDNKIIGDISRIIDLCGSNDFSVSKIFYTGYIINGFNKKLQDKLNVETKHIEFSPLNTKEGQGYMLEIDDIEFGGEFSNALGLCIYPML